MKKIILIITSILFFVGCKEHNTQIAIINKSNVNIFFDSSSSPQKDSICKCFSCCGNKKLLYVNHPNYNGEDNTIAPNSTKYESHQNWRSIIKDLEDGKITISIFNRDSLRSFTWEEMYGQKKWIKQYRLSEKDLDSLNWTIIFDGK